MDCISPVQMTVFTHQKESEEMEMRKEWEGRLSGPQQSAAKEDLVPSFPLSAISLAPETHSHDRSELLILSHVSDILVSDRVRSQTSEVQALLSSLVKAPDEIWDLPEHAKDGAVQLGTPDSVHSPVPPLCCYSPLPSSTCTLLEFIVLYWNLCFIKADPTFS